MVTTRSDLGLFDAEDSPRRVRVLVLTFEALAELLQLDASYALRVEGWPAGAVVVGAEIEQGVGAVKLYLQHESFPEVLEGLDACADLVLGATKFSAVQEPGR